MQNFLKIGWSSAHIFDCQDGGHPTSLISKFWTFCKKFKLALNSMPVCKISSTSDDWLPSYGILSIFSMASVRYFRLMKTRVFFSVKIGGFAGKLWCIFDFQTAVRPPSWIWCDVITDHARCLFNGPNMLNKFDVDWLYSISSFLYSAILASKWPVQAPKSFL